MGSKTTWNPQRITMMYIQSKSNKKEAFKRFRSSSSSYISKSEIKNKLINKDSKCLFCGSKDYLQIDHKKSVHQCFKDRDFEFCNSIENLQVLCRKCNAGKTP